MHILYSLTIHPLELFYTYAYLFCFGLTKSYAGGLLCLAVISTVIFTPLKHLAMGIQARERQIQDLLAPQIRRIRETSAGSERHARIAALYERYAYHPILALRSTCGVMLQVPFLFGAYAMISSFTPLKGHGFWKITDLSQPDQLLWGLNLLPVLMTLFNIGAAFTTKGLTRKERIQSLVIALLFLVLLYAAPAALLIYWTANNLLLLLQNLTEERISAWAAARKKKRPVSFEAYLPGIAAAAPRPATARFFHAARSAFAAIPARFFGAGERAVYAACVAALGVLLLLFNPAALYASSPDIFDGTYGAYILSLAPWAVTWTLMAVVFRLLLPKKARPALTLLLLAATVLAMLANFIFTRDFGPMDGAFFMTLAGFERPVADKIMDAAMYALAAALLFLLYRKGLARLYTRVLCFMTAAMILFCLAVPWRIHASAADETPAAALPDLPAYNDKAFGFSKEGHNCLVFILDSVTGEHVSRIMNEDPRLREQFGGFTWYPDTLAAGNNTLLSIPAIYGGEAYTPRRINERGGKPILQTLADASAVMPNAFIAAGYDALSLGPGLPIGEKAFRAAVEKPDSFLFLPSLTYAYEHRWRRKIGMNAAPEKGDAAFFVMAVSLFRAVPFALKDNVYDRGRWLGANAAMAKTQFTAITRRCAELGMLPDVANTGSPNPTLKIFYSMLPHFPWMLPEDSLVPAARPVPGSSTASTLRDGIYLEHLFVEHHALRLLGDFFDWMRRSGIFDNATVILVSDHGYDDAPQLQKAFPHGTASALLMVKRPGDTGPFAVSPALMSVADVPSLACEAVGGRAAVPPLPDTGQGRVRYFHQGDYRWQSHRPDAFIVKEYTVTGSMLAKESWHGK